MFLRYVDPFAKACLPTYYSTYVNSRDYYDTMNDVNRVFYNLIYRFMDVYKLSFVINDTANRTLMHEDDNTSKTRAFQDYVFYFKQLGQLIGDMFKYVWSSRVIG
jgi:hypothetical protein